MSDTIQPVSDAVLLHCYLQHHDELAFSELMDRHGPMVLATCRRRLGNGPDAEDAFQATFLVLALKAGAIRQQHLLGPWLYRIACLTAGKIQQATQRQTARQHKANIAPDMIRSDQEAIDIQDDLALLDQALAGLPEKFQSAIVLCDLQGVSRREAAKRLKISEGTLSSRIARGREQLHRKLAPYLGVVTLAFLLALLQRARAPLVVPVGLKQGAIQAAQEAATKTQMLGTAQPKPVALAEGVMKNMLWNKLKLMSVAVTACLLASVSVYIHAKSNQAAPQEPIIVAGVPIDVNGEELFHAVGEPRPDKLKANNAIEVVGFPLDVNAKR